MSEKTEKYTGCLVGGAIGDALGGPVEFMSEAAITREYPKGVREFESAGRHWPEGTVTDDTQMTLFNCEGILDARESHGDVVELTYEAQKRWYKTQTYRGPDEVELNTMRLLGIPALYHQRAPGSTCMGALQAGKPLNRGTCGGVMRSAPFGLQDKTPEACFKDAASAAALTHGVPDGYLPAGALAMIIRCLILGDSLDTAVRRSLARLAGTPGPTRRLLRLALQMGAAVTDERRAGMADFCTMQRRVRLHGTGFDGPSALAIAVYAVAAAKGGSFLDMVSLAVTHGGDSDSTGAIAGNIAGAMLGSTALPPKLAEAVEFGDVLAYYAQELAT